MTVDRFEVRGRGGPCVAGVHRLKAARRLETLRWRLLKSGTNWNRAAEQPNSAGKTVALPGIDARASGPPCASNTKERPTMAQIDKQAAVEELKKASRLKAKA